MRRAHSVFALPLCHLASSQLNYAIAKSCDTQGAAVNALAPPSPSPQAFAAGRPPAASRAALLSPACVLLQSQRLDIGGGAQSLRTGQGEHTQRRRPAPARVWAPTGTRAFTRRPISIATSCNCCAIRRYVGVSCARCAPRWLSASPCKPSLGLAFLEASLPADRGIPERSRGAFGDPCKSSVDRHQRRGRMGPFSRSRGP